MDGLLLLPLSVTKTVMLVIGGVILWLMHHLLGILLALLVFGVPIQLIGYIFIELISFRHLESTGYANPNFLDVIIGYLISIGIVTAAAQFILHHQYALRNFCYNVSK